jgi:WD40 repeat protein
VIIKFVSNAPQAGKHIFEIKEAEQPITAVAWAPDGESFVVGSFDKSRSLNTHSALDGHAIHAWPALYRVTALAISPDGKRLVTISSDQRIFVYNFVTREEEYSLRVKTKMTSIAISRDSKEMLVNMADDELQLINIHSAEIVRRFRGQKQGEDFVIRSTFGGSDENLVISGSEGKFTTCTRFLVINANMSLQIR